MFTKHQLERLLFFDIETSGKHQGYSEFYQTDDEGSDIWDKKSNRLKKDTPIDFYESEVSLFPEFGQIVCLSYGTIKDGTMQISTIKNEGDTLEMMKKIHVLFSKAEINGLKPTGWNIKNFDVPWVNRQCLMNGIPVPMILSTFDKKPWEVNVLDLKEVWKSGSTLDVTFEEAAYAMGIPSPKDDIDGSQVHENYHAGNLERIVTYCEKDVKTMILMCEKLSKIYEN